MPRRAPSDGDAEAQRALLSSAEHLENALYSQGLTGLQRLTPASLSALDALVQSAHNAGLFTVERLFETLSTQCRRYLDRDPLFRVSQYTGTVNKLWLTLAQVKARARAGASPEAMVDLVGEARRSYVTAPAPLTLQCLAASGWVSDTDYVGITALFAAEGAGDAVYECSNAKPTMYFGNDPRQLLHQSVGGVDGYAMADLLHGSFVFDPPKVSADRRLSLHKDLTIRPSTYLGLRAYAPFRVASWRDLVARIRQRGVSVLTGLEAVYAMIEPSRVSALVVDEKEARAVATLYDAEGAAMTLDVALREENNFVVDNLERLYGDKRQVLRPGALFGRVTVRRGALCFAPLTALYDQAVRLGGRNSGAVNEVHLSLEPLGKLWSTGL